MKKLVLIGIFLATSSAYSQDYQLDLDVQGLFVGGIQFSSINIDLGLSPRYLRANGSMKDFVSGLMYPATGTCFTTESGGALCNLRVGSSTFDVDLNSSLNGTVTARDPTGNIVDTGSVVFSSLE